MAKKIPVSGPPRDILKQLGKFARKEYEEKRLKEVDVRQVKSKAILTRGVLPELSIKQRGLINYLIVTPGDQEYRCYLFDMQGHLLGSQNIPPASKAWKTLVKGTRRLVHYTREKPKVPLAEKGAEVLKKIERIARKISRELGVRIPGSFEVKILPSQHFATKTGHPGASISEYRLLGKLGTDGEFLLNEKYVDSPLLTYFFTSHLLGRLIPLELFTPEASRKKRRFLHEIFAKLLAIIYLPEGTTSVALEWWEATTRPIKVEGHLFNPTGDSARLKEEILRWDHPGRIQILHNFMEILHAMVEYGLILSPLEAVKLYEHLCGEIVEDTAAVEIDFFLPQVILNFLLNLLDFEITQAFTVSRLHYLCQLAAVLGFFNPGVGKYYLSNARQNLEDIKKVVSSVPEPPDLAPFLKLANGNLSEFVDLVREGNFDQDLDPRLLSQVVQIFLDQYGLDFSHKFKVRAAQGDRVVIPIRVQNLTEVPLMDFDIQIAVTPKRRFETWKISRDGPSDLHYELNFNLDLGVPGTMGRGKIDLTAVFRDPLSEKTIDLSVGTIEIKING